MARLERNLLATAVLGFFAVCVAYGAELALVDSHKGKVVSCGSSKLTLQDLDGKSHTFEVSKNAKITRDGKAAKLEDIMKGDSVMVTTEKKEDKTVATAIEAKSQKAPGTDAIERLALAENTHEGTVLAAGERMIKVLLKDGKSERIFDVTPETKITRDGKAAKLEDLKRDDHVRVTTERKLLRETATEIEARTPKK